MNILIAGDGDTASHLARQLSLENQDVTLMGLDAARLSDLDFRFNILVLSGNAASPESLREANVANADLFISVTPKEYVNIIASQLAKSMGAKRTVARIDTSEYLHGIALATFRSSGLDTLVYPEHLAACEIVDAVKNNSFRRLYSIGNGEIKVIIMKVAKGTSLDGMALKDFGAKYRDIHVAAIKRSRHTLIPRGDDILMAGDNVYFTTGTGGEVTLASLAGRSFINIKRILVSGGSKICRELLPMLSGYEVKVVEKDRNLCRELAKICPKATIVNADPSQVETLVEEGISKMHAFISLDPSSERNIVACMMARELGVPFTVAQIEDIQYFREADALDIDIIVNKKLLTSSTILQMLLDHDLKGSRCLAIEDAEVAQIEAMPGSKITRAPVAKLPLHRDMTIAGLIRNGQGMLVNGATRIQAGDQVVVFSLVGSLPDVKRLFK